MGDRVRVIKEGSHTGRHAVVSDIDWGDRVKVKMIPDAAEKSYLPTELEKVSKELNK